jgi:hypothetical protein
MSPGEPALFGDAWQAVRFAMTRTGAPSRPIMNRMTDTSLPETGLAGLDGAAQAGIIVSLMHRLGPVAEASLIATCAPHTAVCSCRRPCCSGHAFNAIWNRAVTTLADAVPLKLPYGIKLGAILKIYGTNLTLARIARQSGYDPHTVGKHFKLIQHWLKGKPATRDSKAEEGVEAAAWKEIESLLRDRGIVG